MERETAPRADRLYGGPSPGACLNAMRSRLHAALGGLSALALACADDGGTAASTGSSSSSAGDPASSSGPVADSTSTGEASTGDTGTSSGSSSTGADSDGGSSTTGMAPVVDMGCPECTVLVDGLVSGRGIALDDTHVYFTDQSEGTVSRIQKGGGDGGVLVGSQDTPYDIAVDATHVYWTNYVDAGDVMRAPKEGGAAEVVASSVRPRPITVDGTHVYWGTFDDAQGLLYRRDTALAASAELLADMTGGIAELALGKGRIYWTAHTTTVGQGFIVEPPMGPPIGSIFFVGLGGVIDPFMSSQIVTEQAEPWGLAYLPGGRLFWANGDGVGSNLADSVVTLPPGGAPQVVSSAPSAPWGIAVDTQFVYWTDTQLVMAAPVDGGDVVPLADLQNNARSIAVDDDWVFWITKNRVLQRPKP